MEEDRISKLPDEILHHILSKTGIKEAVSTSILSKRWRTLWSSLPNLSFSLAKECGITSAWSQYSDCLKCRFEHFVIQFLSHRDHTSAICEFQLSSVNAMDPEFFHKCLDYAVNEGVHRLDLDAHGDIIPLEFPDSLFASTTLRVLKLRQYKYDGVVIPKPFILSNLKTLYLECYDFRDDYDACSFTKEPFSSFPNLEKLTLDCCDVSGLIISASEIRVLQIFNNCSLWREKKIEEISTPKLTSFRYEGSISLVCPKVDFRCLEEVYFDISPILETPYTDDIKKKMPLNTVRMLQQLGNATFITLTSTTIEVLELDLHLLNQSQSPFPNLKCLKLKSRTKKVPPTVKNYLTKGSSFSNSLVVEGMIE